MITDEDISQMCAKASASLMVEEGLDDLDAIHQVAYVCYEVEGHLCGGGLRTLYSGDFGAYANKIPQVLELVGASVQKDIFDEANSLFGDRGPKKSRFWRRRQLKRMSDDAKKRFDELALKIHETERQSHSIVEFCKEFIREELNPGK